MREIVGVISDLHSNSSLGVHPPHIRMSDGRRNLQALEDAQLWLWRRYMDFRQCILAKKKHETDPVYIVVNGELTDMGRKHNTNELLSTNIADMIKIGVATVEPYKEIATGGVLATGGTEAHSGVGGEIDEAIAAMLGTELCPSTGAYLWGVGRMELQGIRLDFTHHGRVGTRDWTLTNQLAPQFIQVMMYYAKLKKAPPDIVVMGHVHHKTDSGDNFPIRIITTPGWQLRAYYALKMPYSLADIGGTIIVIEDGQIVDVDVVTYLPEKLDVWRPSQSPSSN